MEEEKKTETTEVKEETPVVKKKKHGALYWIIVLCGTAFIIVGSYLIGYKLGNYYGDSNSTPKKNNNVVSNSNSNETSNQTQTLTVEEALNTGRELYKKAIATYPSPLSGALDSKCTNLNKPTAQGLEQYDCTSLYNELKTIYPENNDVFKNFKLIDGKYIYEVGGIGFVGKITSTLAVKSIESDKIVFMVDIDLYNEADKSTTKYNSEFVIVKENDTWKISSYKYVSGDNPSFSEVK